jgi:hypothetical protein
VRFLSDDLNAERNSTVGGMHAGFFGSKKRDVEGLSV